MSRITVGVDATTWLLRRGFGRHTRCLLSALVEADPEAEYRFFVDSAESAASVPSRAIAMRVPAAAPAIAAATAHGRRRLADLWRMSRALSDPGLDALVFPTLLSYVPVWTRARRVLFLHDDTAERFPEMALGSRSARWLWAVKSALGRGQADQLVTVSEYSRAAIASRYGVAPERIAVVGEAADPVFRVLEDAAPAPALRERGLTRARRLVVHVGGFSPHKNLGTLVDVFAGLARRPEFADVDLVFAGDDTSETFVTAIGELRRRVAETDVAGRVIFTGFLPDEVLVNLLNFAALLVLPSLNEGFGLPAIEAAACGCPVIATRASPLPQILGDAARYVDPREPEDLARALAEVLSDPAMRRRMKADGLAAARRHDWRTPARELAALVRGRSGSP